MTLRIIVVVLVLIATSLGLKANGVTFTQEELVLLEQKLYDGPIRIGSSEEQQSLVRYAWEISRNIDFILTIEAESRFIWNAVGDGGTSYGLCQRHNPGQVGWRKKSTDPVLENGYTMLDKCWESRQIKGKKIGSWLHGYKVRHKVKNRFINI